MHVRACCLIGIVSVTLAAAEPASPSYDVRLVAGLAPGADTYELSDVTWNGTPIPLVYDSSLEPQVGTQVMLQVIVNHPIDAVLGFAYGAGIYRRSHQGSQAGGSANQLMGPGETFDATYDTLGIELTFGPAYRIHDHLHGELRGFGGVGRGEQDNNLIDLVASGSHSTQAGITTTYGAVVGLYFTLTRFQIGLEAGYLAFKGKSEETVFDGTDTLSGTSITGGSGATLGLAIGMRL